MKLLKLFAKSVALDVAKEMTYKTNFLIKIVATGLGDVVGPLVTFFIYANTSGIPGWSLYEFILFQGVATFVIGLGKTFFLLIPYEVTEYVLNGEFDKILVKPYNALLYMTSMSFMTESIPEIIVGLGLIGYGWYKLQVSVTAVLFLLFFSIILLGCLVQYASMIFIAALAFLVIRSEVLIDFFFRLIEFARYPLNMYTATLQTVFVFIFPIAVIGHFPTEALLRGLAVSRYITIVIPVLVFFSLSLLAWNFGIKKYSSAGG